MRIASWNVNSVRARVDHVTAVLTRNNIDVLALQETKCKAEHFPTEAFAELGYESAQVGFSQWNGVALLSRVGLSNVSTALPYQPGFSKDDDAQPVIEARAITAQCGPVEVTSLYVPHGRGIGDPHYDYKLQFFEAIAETARQKLVDDPHRLAVYVGDFNVAPTDNDVWDRSLFAGHTSVGTAERVAFAELELAGLTEVTGPLTGDQYTYYDYKGARFFRGEGMRIDFHYATAELARRATQASVDITERGTVKTSDHVPLIVDYDLD
ncbi:exodeoxyribonuclease III [Corynebacterium choanae]|uniref:Exodeoxyribonuclease III n=1 Tax=Corynebacterium choanae TaxID=1862358 RepID=A0A3G6J9I8_9CORY|nr:exodeoxyribonuclease III [Corynebacterium choanae]AZA12694.1 Exodeoxyribonuclease III [Corynebacterium choanae]